MSNAANAPSDPPRTLFEFKAGILSKRGRMIHADERRGKVLILQGDDGIRHLQWRLRPSDAKEIDVMLLPPVTWEQVPECTDGRVYLLRFPESKLQHFFWVQEPATTANGRDELYERVCSLIPESSAQRQIVSEKKSESGRIQVMNARQALQPQVGANKNSVYISNSHSILTNILIL
jgi:hypothetical protein